MSAVRPEASGGDLRERVVPDTGVRGAEREHDKSRITCIRIREVQRVQHTIRRADGRCVLEAITCTAYLPVDNEAALLPLPRGDP